MSIGYAFGTAKLNSKADQELLGVRLGKVCIKKDIPVSYVAAKLQVSRQTVYNWFAGYSSPTPTLTANVEKLLAKLKARA